MPQLACSALRACAAVFPKGVLERARSHHSPTVSSNPGASCARQGKTLRVDSPSRGGHTYGMSASRTAVVPCFTLVLCAGLLAACAPGGPELAALPPSDDASGGEGAADDGPSPGGRPILECEVDSDCLPSRVGSLRASSALVSATCKHLASDNQPVCECDIGGSYLEPTTGEYQNFRGPFDPGNRIGGCSEFGRSPGSCLYCESEFPGCDIADATSCDAICADMVERLRVEWERTLPVTTRLARCVKKPNELTCDTVFELDGKCYSGPLELQLAPLDCSLSDEELVTHRYDPNQYGTCAPRPEVACTHSGDCPRGLACNAGTCAPCGQICTGSCGLNETCAAGEVCVSNTCVLEANAACNSFTDCVEGESCLVSGISATGRGNESTYSFCQAYPR